VFDLMLVFAFQVVYGYVFSWIGLLVACFMAGAAIGAMLATRILARATDCLRLFAGIELGLVCWSFGWPLTFAAVHAYPGTPWAWPLARMLFLIISLICGLLVGSQFPLANKIHLQKGASVSRTAGMLYASDLLGGWFGGISAAVLLLPVLGFAGTGIAVGMLKLASFIVIATGARGHRGGGKVW